MAAEHSSGPIEAFAETHGLAYAERPELATDIDLLSRSGADLGPGATGKLPGDIKGTLSHYDYTTTDSDNHTYHHPFTIVLTQVPESMGFAPALGFSGKASGVLASVGGNATKEVDLGEDESLEDASLYAYEGINEGWLHELVSPSLLDWLARSPDDFGFQLSNGALCVARNNHLTAVGDLEALCNDASHLAAALRKEAVEEVQTGGAEATAAKKPKTAEDTMVANAMRKFGAGREVPSINSAERSFRRMILLNPGTWLFKFFTALVILLVINIPGVALPIVLSVNGQYTLLAAIEGALLLIIFFFVMRSHVRSGAEKYANEAFFRAYARDRKLTIEDPLHFSAVNAEAGITFTPEHVLSGDLPGGATGSLALVGNGLKRADRIALVTGPKGPTAALPLEVSPPGLSADDLDGYAKRLAAKVAEERAAGSSG